MWIGNNGRVKRRAARFARRDWTAGDHPLHRIAILEIHIVEIRRERVEPERRISRVKARLAAIAINYLRPHYRRAGGLHCAVILRATLNMLGIVSSNRQALKLQRRKSLIEIVEKRRNRGQQLVAGRKARRTQGATVTLR